MLLIQFCYYFFFHSILWLVLFLTVECTPNPVPLTNAWHSTACIHHILFSHLSRGRHLSWFQLLATRTTLLMNSLSLWTCKRLPLHYMGGSQSVLRFNYGIIKPIKCFFAYALWFLIPVLQALPHSKRLLALYFYLLH